MGWANVNECVTFLNNNRYFQQKGTGNFLDPFTRPLSLPEGMPRKSEARSFRFELMPTTPALSSPQPQQRRRNKKHRQQRREGPAQQPRHTAGG